MSTRNVLIKSYIGSYQKEKHDPGTAVAWTKKRKRPKSFSVGGWSILKWKLTPTGHQGNRTTIMASNCALKCWYQELMGHISGMIEDVTNRGIRRLRFARNPCEPVIETTSMLTVESRLLLVRILFRGS